jgi:hypothetical protein
MRKFFFTASVMFVGLAVFVSCNNESVGTPNEIKNLNYTQLKSNFSTKISSLESKVCNDEKIIDFVNKYVGIRKKSEMSQKSRSNENIEIEIKLASHYTPNEKKFMLTFYNELANCYDDKIINLINVKRIELNSEYYSDAFKSEMDFIFFEFEESTKAVFNLRYQENNLTSKMRNTGAGLKDCLTKNGASGKDVGRNLVLGAATGAATGAYIGGTTGTFTVPILGTAIGAVGGAVFGGATGAVSGVVSGFIWPAIDCIMVFKSYEQPYLNDEYFNEIMQMDLTDEQIEEFNVLLNSLPNERVVIKEGGL